MVRCPGFCPGWCDKIDFDQILSYKTFKVIHVVDRRLGTIHYGVMLIIFAYIVGYVFIFEKMYYKTEDASGGAVITKVKGLSFSNATGSHPSLPFDEADVVYPGMERGALFISTKIQTTENQQRNVCKLAIDRYRCKNDSDCRDQPPLWLPECADGFCLAYQWCPCENETFPNEVTTEFALNDTSEFTVWIRSSITFPHLARHRLYSTMHFESPVTEGKDKNVWTVEELLNLGGANWDWVKDNGSVMNVKLYWQCNVQFSSCRPDVSVYRMDNGRPINFRRPLYYQVINGSNAVLGRDLYKYTGIRFMITSFGTGYKFSIESIVLQLASGIALLSLSGWVADFAMLHILPERKIYRKFKIRDTPDFSEIREEIRRKKNEDKEKKRRHSVDEDSERSPLVTNNGQVIFVEHSDMSAPASLYASDVLDTLEHASSSTDEVQGRDSVDESFRLDYEEAGSPHRGAH